LTFFIYLNVVWHSLNILGKTVCLEYFWWLAQRGSADRKKYV